MAHHGSSGPIGSKVLWGVMQEVHDPLHFIPFEVILVLFDVVETSSSDLTKIMTCIGSVFQNLTMHEAQEVHKEVLAPTGWDDEVAVLIFRHITCTSSWAREWPEAFAGEVSGFILWKLSLSWSLAWDMWIIVVSCPCGPCHQDHREDCGPLLGGTSLSMASGNSLNYTTLVLYQIDHDNENHIKIMMNSNLPWQSLTIFPSLSHGIYPLVI